MDSDFSAEEIRDALEKLTNELKLTRIAFAAIQTTIEDLIDSDAYEGTPGYTSVKRDMN